MATRFRRLDLVSVELRPRIAPKIVEQRSCYIRVASNPAGCPSPLPGQLLPPLKSFVCVVAASRKEVEDLSSLLGAELGGDCRRASSFMGAVVTEAVSTQQCANAPRTCMHVCMSSGEEGAEVFGAGAD